MFVFHVSGVRYITKIWLVSLGSVRYEGQMQRLANSESYPLASQPNSIYRSAGSSSWSRRLKLRCLWILKIIEGHLCLRKMLAVILAFLLALAMLPGLALLASGLWVSRRVTGFLLGRIYPNMEIVPTRNLRSALDTRRCPGSLTLLLTANGALTLAELRARVAANLPYAPPCASRRLALKFGWYLWGPSKPIDVAAHVVSWREVRRTRGPVTDVNLQDVVSDLCSRPFPSDRSPWEVVLIPVPSSSASAVLVRLHHLLAEEWDYKELFGPMALDLWPDGNNLPLLRGLAAPRKLSMGVVSSVKQQWETIKSKCDPSLPPISKDAKPTPFLWQSVCFGVGIVHHLMAEVHKLYELTDTAGEEGRGSFGRIISLATMLPGVLRQVEAKFMSGSLIGSGRRLLSWLLYAPVIMFVLFTQVVVEISSSVCAVGFFFRRLLSADDADALLLRKCIRDAYSLVSAAFVMPWLFLRRLVERLEPVPLLQCRPWSGRRVLAWAEPVPQTLLASVAKAAGATQSDVLVAACAGVLRHYFRTLGVDIPDVVSATAPIGVDVETDEVSGSKQVQGFAVVPLPTGESNPGRRLGFVRDAAKEIRSRPLDYSLSVFVLDHVTHLLPQPLLTLLLNYLSHKHPVTVSQISLPPVGDTLTPPDAPVTQVRYWRPAQGNIGLAFTLLTYEGHVAVSVASDREVLPQPSVITNQFVREVNDMALALGVRLDRSPPFPRITSPPSVRTPTTTRKNLAS